MNAGEFALVLDCQQAALLAIHHAPQQPYAGPGVVLVVGGPQYRVGSHRQFVLLARALADAGIPVLRFDYRGMGDSEGELRDFADVNQDIRAAVDALLEQQQGLQEVVILGLCDAASAAAFYAWTDTRVTGLVLINPWVRTEAGEAKAYLQHYYLQRLTSQDFWRKVLRFQFDFGAAFGSILSLLGQARGEQTFSSDEEKTVADLPLPERMLHGLRAFPGRVLLVLSGEDLVAREFEDLTKTSVAWGEWLARSELTLKHLAAADHTFSRRVWRDQVASWTTQWLKK